MRLERQRLLTGGHTCVIDRRRVPRRRSLKCGVIAFDGRFSTADCTVRNLTASGASLRLASTAGIPERFELRMRHHNFRWCRVKWRRVDAMGIEFE